MLYKLEESTDGPRLAPVAFNDFSAYAKREKDLENLVAGNILDTLFEDSGLMPIHQERSWQPEADIYALNAEGDLIIFELKRSVAGNDAVQQALRYAQDAGRWTYSKLQERHQTYSKSALPLVEAHQQAFDLEHALDKRRMNAQQHLYIIGSAADKELIASIDYWKRQGLRIDFLPYRLYELAHETYFEFFAPPYDVHANPAAVKGVLFDTNLSWDADSLWHMMENSIVAAYGDAQRFVGHVYPGDLVFYSHKWAGLVAAGRVKRGEIKAPDDETQYREVEMLTPVPKRGEPLKALPFRRVSEITGKSFFWARTIKVPYLSREEAENLLESLREYLASE